MTLKAHRHDYRLQPPFKFTAEWRPARRADPATFGGSIASGCTFCGSVRPDELAAALRAGARLDPADRKYGWPHKFYVEGFPHPFPGTPEVRGSRSDAGGRTLDPPTPAGATIFAKFYTEHLQDAEPADRDVIEQAMGMSFTFGDDGSIAWRPYRASEPAKSPAG